MEEILFAYDKNLELDVNDPVLNDFFKSSRIKPNIYDNMRSLTQDMVKNKISLSYLPAANYFYFKDDNFYRPIANAQFAANRSDVNSSLLVVRKDSNVKTLADLRGKSLGYIHPFCTSSYFAPAILLQENGDSIETFFSSKKMVGAWQLQVDAVINRVVDATSIQEDIWHRLPKNSEFTKIIASIGNLPSPLILAAQNLDPSFVKEFSQLLLSYKPESKAGLLFNGFIPFDEKLVASFYQKAELAFQGDPLLQSFNIKTS